MRMILPAIESLYNMYGVPVTFWLWTDSEGRRFMPRNEGIESETRTIRGDKYDDTIDSRQSYIHAETENASYTEGLIW